jgi:hypothetical protein
MNPVEEKEFTEIAVLESIIEAQLVESILEDRKIPFRIQSYHDTAYNGLFQFQKGWGRIFAFFSSRQEIMVILDQIRSKKSDFYPS